MDIEKLKILMDAVQRLSLARSIDTIKEVVRKTARSLTGADGATFVLKDNDMCYYAEEDSIAPLWKGQRFPISSCISGWAMINKQAAIIEDVYSDDRVPKEAYRPTFVKSLVMVPIRTIEPIGAIGNYWATPHKPTIKEMELLQSLADITSVSIENVYAYNELKQQNKLLYDIAVMQSHQVKEPIANIQGLYSLFNFDNLTDPQNVEVLKKLKTIADSFDEIIKEMVQNTNEIKRLPE